MPRRLSDNEIAIRVVPTMLRWPPEIAFNEIVTALKRYGIGCVSSTRAAKQHAERDTDLKPRSISRRRIQLGEEALAELADLEPLHRAERGVDEPSSTSIRKHKI